MYDSRLAAYACSRPTCIDWLTRLGAALRKQRSIITLWVWSVYVFHWTYHILSGIRMTIIAVNFVLLLNVIAVFVRRLRANETPEIQQLKKATKAIVLLTPLLGLTNFVGLIREPLDPVGFFVVNGLRRLILCWQGFLVAIYYCLLNRQVRSQLRRSMAKFKLMHRTPTISNHSNTLRMGMSRLPTAICSRPEAALET
ncbi:hypothetical protein PHET_03076 [Paragonimus heterotremus]|uniref:G-protein coupled receptors family 2 profile 2 domain-containing protein n=1 Tax=Paragonimus heterotremus TaxID=100268 RepID=A0A8J4WTF8_9TREM|nr:hypothetical protein PHET_03076 [Paragonimus heterotremus]